MDAKEGEGYETIECNKKQARESWGSLLDGTVNLGGCLVKLSMPCPSISLSRFAIPYPIGWVAFGLSADRESPIAIFRDREVLRRPCFVYVA